MLHVPGWRDERNREERQIMKQNVIILSCGEPWAFKDEKTGEERSGVSIHYIMADDLTPKDDNGVLGYAPVKESVGKSFYDVFKKLGVPCSIPAEFGMKTKNGSTILYIQGFDLDAIKKK